MNQEDFVQVFQDDDLRDVNHNDHHVNAVSAEIDEPNTSIRDRPFIPNDASFATTSSFNNTKFDPMSSSDHIDHYDHQKHSVAAEFGFLPRDSPLTTNTFHSGNFSRPQMQRTNTGNSVEMFANLPQSNTSESVNTLIRNVSTKSFHVASTSAGTNKRSTLLNIPISICT